MDDTLACCSKILETVYREGGLVMPQLKHVDMARNTGEPPYPDAPPASLSTATRVRTGQ